MDEIKDGIHTVDLYEGLISSCDDKLINKLTEKLDAQILVHSEQALKLLGINCDFVKNRSEWFKHVEVEEILPGMNQIYRIYYHDDFLDSVPFLDVTITHTFTSESGFKYGVEFKYINNERR